MESFQIRIGAKHFLAVCIKKHQAGRVFDIQLFRPVDDAGGLTIRLHDAFFRPHIQHHHVELVQQFTADIALQNIQMQFVAGDAMFLLEHHQQRLAILQRRLQVVRCFHTGVLCMQFAAGRLRIHLLHVLLIAQQGFLLLADIIQQRIELLRRVITVGAKNSLAVFVEKNQRRCVLYAQRFGELFFGHHLVAHRNFTVAPDVNRHHIKIALCFFGDGFLAKVVLQQFFAIRAAVLIEIQHQPLALFGGFVNVFV